MNSCILMAQIISDPELRSTQDQMSVSTMMVEFESTKEGEDPGKVQVEGWGKLAEDIKSTYSMGDQVIIEGRLSMNLFEMPEGYKEKRAKLVASRIYPLGAVSGGGSKQPDYQQSDYQQPDYQQPGNVVDFAPNPKPQAAPAPAYIAPEPAPNPEPTPSGGGNEDWDEIPF
jgi:single-strand DNA-binding protein